MDNTEQPVVTPGMKRDSLGPERRHLTVLFSDMVGSTALSRRLDPEDLRDLIQLYQKVCTEQIERFGGVVHRFVGDGIMSLFGYPNAHGDDSERAINAAVAIVSQVDSLAPSPLGPDIRIQVRIGIATGLVIAGDGASGPNDIFGETPNLAARMQEKAEPDGVVVHDSTKVLAGARFEYSDLGMQSIKGFCEPVRAWKVIRRRSDRTRFEAVRPSDLTPLIGREAQLGVLLDRWELSTHGRGQVALLTGEAGIGKSRMAQALGEALAGREHTCVRFQCSSYHKDSALHPFVEQLESTARLLPSDSPCEKLEKLERELEEVGLDVVTALPLISHLLSIRANGALPSESMSPQQRKEGTIEVLVDRLMGFATRNPLLVLFEDVQWADPTSMELIGSLIDKVRTEPILFLITFRPELHHRWAPAPHVTEIFLERLSDEDATRLVESMTPGEALATPVVHQIVAKTDGVPLFVEEVTKTLQAGGLMADGDAPGSPLAVPSTIQDTLAARLDQVGDAKELTQLGSVIGRSFSLALLLAATELEPAVLTEGLDRLVASGLLCKESYSQQDSYTFKHALVQEAAHNSLLRRKRQELHARIAGALMRRAPDVPDCEPEVVAHHLFEAGRYPESARLWLQAGMSAIERSANLEAAAHLRNAISATNMVKEPQLHSQLELPIQLNLGVALTASEGFASPLVEAAFARARAICSAAPDSVELFYALVGLGSFYTVRADLDTARDVAERMLWLGRKGDHGDLLLWGHVALGVIKLNLGELLSARHHLAEGVATYDPQLHGQHAYRFGQDAGVTGRCHLAWTECLLGDPMAAAGQMRDALELAERLNQGFSIAYAKTFAAWLAYFMGEPEECKRSADAAITKAEEQRLPLLLGMASVVKGWATSVCGDCVTGLGKIHKGISLYENTGAELGKPAMLGLLALVTAERGDETKALKIAKDALALAQKHKEHLHEPQLQKLIATLENSDATPRNQNG